MDDILLGEADRCMDAYESGADRSESRLVLAKVHVQVAYDRGAIVDKQLNRLINLYRELGAMDKGLEDL